jgi:hypothetical protein
VTVTLRRNLPHGEPSHAVTQVVNELTLDTMK